VVTKTIFVPSSTKAVMCWSPRVTVAPDTKPSPAIVPHPPPPLQTAAGVTAAIVGWTRTGSGAGAEVDGAADVRVGADGDPPHPAIATAARITAAAVRGCVEFMMALVFFADQRGDVCRRMSSRVSPSSVTARKQKSHGMPKQRFLFAVVCFISSSPVFLN
jgi:hypothetical protein